MVDDHISWRTPEDEEPEFLVERRYRPGIPAQRVSIPKPQIFGTRLQGDRQMPVLHDMVRAEGDSIIDGFGRSARHDRRDSVRMEQVPGYAGR